MKERLKRNIKKKGVLISLEEEKKRKSLIFGFKLLASLFQKLKQVLLLNFF